MSCDCCRPPRPLNLMPPRRLGVGALIRIPGFAAEFQRKVPDDHIDKDGSRVRCLCERRYELGVGEFVECAGENHEDGHIRAFLRVERSIRVARWEVPA